MKYKITDFCVDPISGDDLYLQDGQFLCNTQGKKYNIKNGVAILIPDCYSDLHQKSYQDSYEIIAKDDAEQSLEQNRHNRFQNLLRFVGDVQGKRVLDIGASRGDFLSLLNADMKVAFDISFTSLDLISKTSDIICVQGDAEYLPFRPGFFDVIIIDSILEHMLNPEKLIACLFRVSTPKTRIIVEVPWNEHIAQYSQSKYKFTHLRSFNSYNFFVMWWQFRIIKSKKTYPDLRYPYIFSLDSKIPNWLFNFLMTFYHGMHNFRVKDYKWRMGKDKALPHLEKFLLLFFPAVFRSFELRKNQPMPDFFREALDILNRKIGE